MAVQKSHSLASTRPVRTRSAGAGSTRIRQRGFDRPLLYAALVLTISGFLILGSASMALSYKDFGSISYYMGRQFLLGGIIGGALAVACFFLPYRAWKRMALPLMIISFILLALVFIPQISYSSGGARRWIHLGIFSFQPSEILRLSFIVYLASWLDARRKEVVSVSYGMIPFALMIAFISVFLIMQPDIGTLGVIVATAGVLYLLGGGKTSQIAALAGLGLAALYIIIQTAPYRLNRILVFLNPETDPQGIGYQINQAFIAIGSGGMFGRGFGRGLQKYNYLPEPMGDSIFAIFAEEMGFMGVGMLIALFLFFLWRGFLIAKHAPDIFGKLLASGLAVSILIQAFINMASISGLLPLTGIALPFISYGGTSLMITLASVGILLNISKYS